MTSLAYVNQRLARCLELRVAPREISNKAKKRIICEFVPELGRTPPETVMLMCAATTRPPVSVT